jgi:hypothetical protein
MLGTGMGLGLLLALAGCGQPQRSAEEPVDVLGPVGAWFDRDTRICVINESSARPTVTFDRKDNSYGEGVLGPNDRACGEGHFDHVPDVRAIVQPNVQYDPPVLGYEFNGYNQVDPSKNPYLDAKQLFAKERYGVNGMCGWAELNEGSKFVVDDGGPLVYELKRQNNSSAFIEFTVTIKDTQNGNWGGSKPCDEAEHDLPWY